MPAKIIDDPRNAQALALRDEGKTLKEIGEILGVSTATAYQFVRRAGGKKKYKSHGGHAAVVDKPKPAVMPYLVAFDRFMLSPMGSDKAMKYMDVLRGRAT